MTHRYPTLLAAAIAVAFIGAAAAQTQSDDSSRMPANKGMAQQSQTEPSTAQPDKMKGQENSAAQGQSATPYDQKSTSDQNMSSDKAMPSEKSSHKHAMNSHEGGKHAMHSNKMHHEAAGSTDAHHAMNSGKGHMHGASADNEAMNSAGAKHASKSKHPSEETGAPDEKEYREALRDCAKQQDESQRGSCLDTAIERFHRNV
jgi:hypothetical protein